MNLMANLTGLVFELLGAYVLAIPGLRQTRCRRLLEEPKPWHSYRVSVPIGVVLTGAFFVSGFALARFPRWHPAVWAFSIGVSLAWTPAVWRWAAHCLPQEPGEGVREEQSEKLHRRGLLLLGLGFAVQGLAASLP